MPERRLRPFILSESGVLGHEAGFYPRVLNSPPTANFTHSPSVPVTTETVQFVNQSTDPDDNISSYEWDFGDGASSTQENPSHSYSDSTTYTVTLTVTDAEGVSDTYTTDIYIEPAIQVIEDFEDGGSLKSGYTGDYVSDRRVGTDYVHNGSYSLYYYDSDGTATMGNPNISTEPGYRYIWWSNLRIIRNATTNHVGLCLAHTGGGMGSASSYEFGYEDAGNIRIRKRESGNETTLTTGSYSGDYWGWYRNVVEWHEDGTLTYDLYDSSGSHQGGTSTTDTTFDGSSGGLGFVADEGEAYFDYVQKEALL